MTIHNLKPWSELVKLHADVESGELTQDRFAIDLGRIAADDPGAPKVYRDPDAFFAATYVTTDLHRLLEEVLASLAGRGGYNRVLKLRSPFGGGKSHTLAALLHAARSRPSLDQVPGGAGLADPGAVDVAVFDGEKFTAAGDKEVGQGQKVHTMWGWLAWQLGAGAYSVVRKHDAQRVSPQGEEVRAMLEAGGRPVLLLLDEVLKYVEAVGAVMVHDSTLQRQTLNFLHNLTVEVAGGKRAVMVYSLQMSQRQAMGNIALLQTLDALVSRVDQVREPVTGDEVLSVIKRRLLGGEPPVEAATAVAQAYSDVIGGYWQAGAETASGKQDAQHQAVELRNRMRSAYPFHPALLDVMTNRWTSVDEYQRTRGALRFLATALRAAKAGKSAKPLLGPGEIELADAAVRNAMLKDLDPTQAYDPVIRSDITGPSARAKKIDDRLGAQAPALANVRPALRLATAILAYSFGGLKRQDDTQVLPPGVTEAELLAACIGPDLDSVTANSVLADLRNSCLYLHYDGVRYCFKKDPNVTKLIEDQEQEVGRDPSAIRERVKTMLEARLAGRAGAIVWPATTHDLPDREPQFLVGYLPLEWASMTTAEQDDAAKAMLTRCGDGPRKYRNGAALAVPDKKQIEPLRRAVRYLMAIDRVEQKKAIHRLTRDQMDQLRERKRTEESAAETAFRHLYPAVRLPRVEDAGTIGLEKIEIGGRPLQATDIHERVMELLSAGSAKKVHGTLHPRKVAERVRLGESLSAGEPPRLGVATKDVRDAFFEVIEPPRLTSEQVIRQAIARGVAERVFAYTTGGPALGPDQKYEVAPTKVAFDRAMSDDEVDLDNGFLIAPSAVPLDLAATGIGVDTPTATGSGSTGTGTDPTPAAGSGGQLNTAACTSIRLSFAATRDQVFKSFRAIANLADKSADGKVNITVTGHNAAGYDPGWLRNAVEEPLDEADINGLEKR